MTRDRRKGADDTSAADPRAARLGAALRANLQRRKARARALAGDADEQAGRGDDPRGPHDDRSDDDRPGDPAAEG